MKKITLTAAVFFDAGTVLGLTERQARVRMHHLERISEDVYESTSIVQFKRGETLLIKSLPKRLESFVDVEEVKPVRAQAVSGLKRVQSSAPVSTGQDVARA